MSDALESGFDKWQSALLIAVIEASGASREPAAITHIALFSLSYMCVMNPTLPQKYVDPFALIKNL